MTIIVIMAATFGNPHRTDSNVICIHNSLLGATCLEGANDNIVKMLVIILSIT